jgi:hypothetical protein
MTLKFDLDNLLHVVVKETPAPNSGFAQRGVLSFKKSSRCLEVHVSFDTLQL